MASTDTATHATTVDDAEIAHFSAMAEEWWDEKGKFAPLHRMNPCRMQYLRSQIIRHFSGDDASATPLVNLSLLDVGCGGGLICEPLARLGAKVTGIDASEKNISIAEAHAAQSSLAIDYRVSTAEALASSGTTYDVVLALEIVEHVADIDLFYDALIALVKPGGLLLLSTMNRTAKSYALAIVGAEYMLRWLPKGTHDWKKFIKPSEMAQALMKRGLSITDTSGMIYNPFSREFSMNYKDLDVNYLMAAKKPS